MVTELTQQLRRIRCIGFISVDPVAPVGADNHRTGVWFLVWFFGTSCRRR